MGTKYVKPSKLNQNKDYTSNEILNDNLNRFYLGDAKHEYTLTKKYKNEHLQKVNKYIEMYSPKIPRGVIVQYTQKFEIESSTDVMLKYFEKIFANDSKLYNKLPDIAKKAWAKSEAAWEKAVERAMYDIYRDIMNMVRTGLTEYYAQYSPRVYKRTGSQMGSISVSISGSGINTNIDVSYPGGGGYPRIPGVVETEFIVKNGWRALGPHSRNGGYPQTWSFSYSSSILGAYISNTIYGTMESIQNNFGEIIKERANKYYAIYYNMD
jgi:hypothetical protein